MRLRREIGEMERIPRGYGYAYRRWDCMMVVCYPIPLNIVVSLARRVWIRLAHFGSRTDPANVAWQAGHDYAMERDGQRAAREYVRGFDAGVETERRNLRAVISELREGVAR